MEYRSKDFIFEDKAEWERTKKEEEIVRFLRVDPKLKKPEEALKTYHKLVEKRAFTTAAGLSFMMELRRWLIKSGVVTKDEINLIPAGSWSEGENEKDANETGAKKTDRTSTSSPDRQLEKAKKDVKKYQILYESEKNAKARCFIVIVFLVLAVGVMLALSFTGVLTKNSDPEQTQLEDRLATWQEELDAKDQELKAREAALGQ